MSRNPKTLTIHHAQTNQPWTVPYSSGVMRAKNGFPGTTVVPHILGSHAVLHIAKSLGKLAAVFESLDHCEGGKLPPDEALEAAQTIRAMAADLVTGALRIGNLYNFSVAEELVKRVREKNNVDIIEWPTAEDGKELAAAAVFAMNRAGQRQYDYMPPSDNVGATNEHLFRRPEPKGVPMRIQWDNPFEDGIEHVAFDMYAKSLQNIYRGTTALKPIEWHELTEDIRNYWRQQAAAPYGKPHTVDQCERLGCHHDVPDVARRAAGRHSPSGRSAANGMVEGDRIRDCFSGWEGIAGEFTQDGDVSITRDNGQTFQARWNNCNRVEPPGCGVLGKLA